MPTQHEKSEKLPVAARRLSISLSLAGQYCRAGQWPGAFQDGPRGEWWVPRGSEPTRAPNARRVSPAQWRELLGREAAGESKEDLAREYGVKVETIASRKSREKSREKRKISTPRS